MKNIIRGAINIISLVAFFFAISLESAQAATRLTPAHLYNWARTGNTARLEQFQKYINLHDQNKNTALCLAQRAKDRKSYSLLLDYGASTDVECHDDDDKICAIIAGEKTKIHPAAFVLLGLGAAAGAYVLLDDDDDKPYQCLPQNGEFSSKSDCEANNIGYTCKKNNNNCYIRGDVTECPAGYSTAYQSSTDCGSGEFPEGWIFEANDYSGDLICGKCTPKTCNSGTTTCPDASTGFVANHTPNGQYAGDTACLICNYECDTTNGYYDSTDSCTEGGYICSTVTQNGKSCYIRTGSEQCPDTHPTETICIEETESFNNNQSSITVGDRTCYSCNYQCNTANGWQQGTCPSGRDCEQITSPVVCYKDNGCDESQGHYETCPTGFTCTEDATSGCQILASCATGYDENECITGGAGFTTNTNENIKVGDKICYKCAYSCADGYLTNCPTGKSCTEIQIPTDTGKSGNTYCYTNIKCPEGYTEQTIDECQAGGYECQESAEGSGCFTQLYVSECPEGYSTQYPTEESCGTLGGYIHTTNGLSGGQVCGKCDIKTCQQGSTDIQTTTDCSATHPDGYKIISHDISGEQRCNSCQPLTCEEHGDYVSNTTQCTPAPQGITIIGDSSDNKYSGDNICYSCGYECSNGWQTSCPAQNTCSQNAEAPNGYPLTCYLPDGCNESANYFDDINDCTTANNGYTCTPTTVNGVTCYIKGEPSTCTTGSTAYQSVEDCGTTGAQGYTYSSPEKSGDLNCGICTPKTCNSGTTDCPDAFTGFVANHTPNGQYAGDTACLICNYECDTTNGYYDSTDSCTEGGYICSTVTQNGKSCYKRTGSESCSGDYPYDTPCSSGNGYTVKQTESQIGDNTCYQCEYTCDTANGWQQGTCPSGKDCTQITSPIACYKDNGCDESQGYYETCPTGFTCTTDATSGCQVPTACETGYATNASQCPTEGANGWDLGSSYTAIINGSNTSITCGKCVAKECPPNTRETQEDSLSVVMCPAIEYLKANSIEAHGQTAGDNKCYYCGYNCDDVNSFDSESGCTSEGYTCEEKDINTGFGETVKCYVRNGSQSCPTEYPSPASCTTSSEYDTTSASKTQGENTCYKCTYSCKNTGNYVTACPTGKDCTQISLPDGQTCYKDPICPSTHTFTNSESCEADGYYCSESATGSGCWKQDRIKECEDYAPGLHKSDEIETKCTKYEGAIVTQAEGSGYRSGGEACYGCQYFCDETNNWFEQSCPENFTCKESILPTTVTCYQPNGCDTTGAYPSNTACSVPNGTKINTNQSINMNGIYCYQCSYICDEENYYTDKNNCTEGGYTCTEQAEQIAQNSDGTPVMCYKRTGSELCSEDYPYDTECSPGNGYTVKQTESQIGDNTCYQCEYACDTTNGWQQGTCPSGKDCTQITSPIACYKDNGCDESQGYYETCPTGFTCTEDATSGCQVPTACGTNYATNASQCHNTGVNGWYLGSSETAIINGKDETTCSLCTPLPCGDGEFSPEEDINTACIQDNNLLLNSASGTSNTGDVLCNKCEYSCKDEGEDLEGNWTNNDKGKYGCEFDGHTCSLVDFTTPYGATVTCYVRQNPSLTALTDDIAVSNTNKIELTSTGTEDIYGIQTAENTSNTTNLITGDIGSINITHNSTGSAFGMYGTSSNTLLNTQGASINIQNNSTGTAHGMYVSTGGKAYNSGDINITGTNGTAIGIYGEGQNTIENSGKINVSGTDAYGIYVKDGTDTTVTNTETGEITVNATNNAHGIYIHENSANAVVENKGTITVNGEVKDGATGITLNGATLKNFSLVRFSDATDLNALGGKVYLEDGGTYEAKSLEGELNVGTSNVIGTNQDTYIKENSILAETTDNLKLVSESALFTAEKQQNSSGEGYDVVMTRKDFGEFTPNASIKNYLESNYQDGEMVDMFDSIKSQNSSEGVAETIAGGLGYDVMPNFADENFIVMKSLNRNIADTILKPTDEANRVVAGYDNISLETESKALLSGSDLSANSMYTFGDKRLDNKNRLGLGLSFTELSSNYDKGGDRDVSIISIFMPYMHKFSDQLRLASVLSIGYGTGEYDRGSNNESDISDIFYGFTNELRYTIDLNGYAELEPALMLNAIGYTEDGFDEGDGENALETKKTHNLSVEAGIGLFLKKEVQTNEHGKIGFRIGGAYYRELATPYDKIDARIKRGNSSWYRINDYANLYDHDRAILEAAIDYEYKQIGVYAKYNRLIQKNDPEMFDLGIKYKF